jgi:UDP-glucose 4-epimerase
MRFLITGGAGFIGSHLAETLLASGHEVIVLDDLSTGSVDNIRHLKGQSGFQYVLEPVENRPVLAELVDESDLVFHLAAAVGVRLIIESPVHTIRTNINGTQLVLDAAAKKRKPVFIASTSEVYGKNGKLPFREDDDLVLGPTTKARWSYAASKAVEEFLALSYWKERRLPVVIGRLFNTVGPRQTGRYGMVLPTFVEQALAGRPITVFGTGCQRRCFCDVADAVEAIVRLALNEHAYGEVVNIGSQQEITIADLAELVRQRTQSVSPVVFIPYEQAYEPGFEDMSRRIPSLEKLERLTGFVPATPLANIVDRVAAYLRTRSRLAASACTARAVVEPSPTG